MRGLRLKEMCSNRNPSGCLLYSECVVDETHTRTHTHTLAYPINIAAALSKRNHLPTANNLHATPCHNLLLVYVPVSPLMCVCHSVPVSGLAFHVCESPCVVPGLTVDLQAARCLCLSHAVLRHTRVGALVLGPDLSQTQAVVTADL